MLAPSPENAQPFRFEWDGAALHVLHDAPRARVDAHHHDSLLALGHLLVAAEIGAEAEGLRARTQLRVGGDGPWATLRFDAAPASPRRLGVLRRRCTDRRPFRGGSLDHSLRERVRAEAGPDVGLHARAPDDPHLLDWLASAEGFVWDHESIYLGVMRWLRVTQRAVEETRDGASWRTMGFDLPELPGLARLGRPEARRTLRRLGAATAAGLWVRRQARSAGALVLVTVRRPGREPLVSAGRAMMGAWLAFTEADWGVQPHSQPSFFVHEAVRGTLPPEVGDRWRRRLLAGAEVLRSSFALDPDEVPVELLRVGVSDSPPEWRRTLRRPVEAVLVESGGEAR